LYKYIFSHINETPVHRHAPPIVIIINPFKSKFFLFKHKQTQLHMYSETCLKQLHMYSEICLKQLHMYSETCLKQLLLPDTEMTLHRALYSGACCGQD
jgi:hypothetical protein